MLVGEKDLDIACYRLHDACASGNIFGKTQIL